MASLEAEADLLGERVATEQENRRLRFGIVIVNYLFPNEGREFA